MNSHSSQVRLMAAATLLALLGSAAAEDINLVPISFHEIIGEVVDSTENSQFNIFGSITGFEAAKVYPHKTESYELHILRNMDGQAQILLKELHTEALVSLRKGIVERVTLPEGIDHVPDEAVFST